MRPMEGPRQIALRFCPPEIASPPLRGTSSAGFAKAVDEAPNLRAGQQAPHLGGVARGGYGGCGHGRRNLLWSRPGRCTSTARGFSLGVVFTPIIARGCITYTTVVPRSGAIFGRLADASEVEIPKGLHLNFGCKKRRPASFDHLATSASDAQVRAVGRRTGLGLRLGMAWGHLTRVDRAQHPRFLAPRGRTRQILGSPSVGGTERVPLTRDYSFRQSLLGALDSSLPAR